MKKLILIGIIILASVLRLYKLGQVPSSLYWDEASLGYNAYSILKTAKDEHSKFLPITNFAAFGDYKPPGYIYAAVPSVAVFGLNEFAVRFPSALFGIFTVSITYLLAKKLFENETLALLSAFFLAISPWHLQFSRGAFEANLGLFFSTLGIYLFLKFKQNPFWLLGSAVSFILAMYTFTGQRLFVPLILLLLAFHFRQEIFKNLKIVVLSAIIFLILFYPLFRFVSGTIEGRLRFDEVTIFKDLEPINQSVKFREKDGYSWWADIIHNRRLFYSYEYLIHYFDAFNPTFLFFKGDINPRLSIQEVGELYYYDSLLVLAGIYFLINRKQKHRYLIMGWLLIAPLGPATARETPHALRMIHILPTFQLVAAFGIYNFYKWVKYKKLLVTLSAIIISASLFYYLHMYYLHWPKNFSGQWQYGYKEAVVYVRDHYSEFDKIVVTKSQGRPYIYFLLYMQFDPRRYWESAKVTKDKFFFLDVEGFDKITFTDNSDDMPEEGKILYVLQPGQLPQSAAKVKTISNLEGREVFDIGERK